MDSSEERKRHYRTIFLSDIHLGARGCQADRLIDFLKQHDCERLYLVGDIVDGWRMKSSMFWPQAHSNVVRRLLTLAKRGTEIVYVTGNHDEFLRRYSDHHFGNIELCDRAVHLGPNGERYLVVHGDEYDVITRYHRWIAWLGDIGYNLLLEVNRFNNWIREHLGFGRWSLSAWVKHKVKRAVNFISEFEDAVAQDCEKEGFDGVVCGHIHHAEIRQIGNIRYMNCGDWVESCTALVEDEQGHIEVIHWLGDEATQVLPLGAPEEPALAIVRAEADRAA